MLGSAFGFSAKGGKVLAKTQNRHMGVDKVPLDVRVSGLSRGQGRKGVSIDPGKRHMCVDKVPLDVGVSVLSRGQGRKAVSKDLGKGHMGLVKVPLGVGVSISSRGLCLKKD